ncbi:MAG: hypothetical protein P4M12_04110 [Gammaproteobacteria bacterium]|nr:hypothetical protein [Gammaproteobacteria bacterium]
MRDRLLSESHPDSDAIPRYAVAENHPRLLFAYNSLPAEKKEQLKEVTKDEFSDERIEKHFNRIIALNNVVKLQNVLHVKHDLLLDYTDEDLITFISWYKHFGLSAVLFHETLPAIKQKIKDEPDGLIKEILIAIKLLQEEGAVNEVAAILHSVYKPRDLQHAFHLYNKKGLNFDLYLYSRKGVVWLATRILREPLTMFGDGTTLMLGYKLTLGNLNSIGVSQTAYLMGSLWVIKSIYDFREKIQGIDSSSGKLDHWVRLLLKSMNDLIHCRNPKVKFRSILQPMQDYSHFITYLFVFTLGSLVFNTMIEDFFKEHLNLDVTGTPFQRIFEPYILIWPAVSLLLNLFEACKEILSPCKECEFKADVKMLVEDESQVNIVIDRVEEEQVIQAHTLGRAQNSFFKNKALHIARNENQQETSYQELESHVITESYSSHTIK